MAEADATLPETGSETRTPERRRWGRLLLMLSVPLALLIGGFIYWQGLQGKVSTDNAYVQQDMVAVSAEVGGKIVEVMVEEDEQVAAGDLLFRIDPEPYELQIAQANAAIANAQANVTALANSADLSGADIAAAREDTAFARSRFQRQAELMQRGFTTNADYDAEMLGASFLDSARFPTATYRATAFRALGGNRYVADGILSLHGVEQPVALEFTWTPGPRPLLAGRATVRRLAFGVGAGDWADTRLIPDAIAISTRVYFQPR